MLFYVQYFQFFVNNRLSATWPLCQTPWPPLQPDPPPLPGTDPPSSSNSFFKFLVHITLSPPLWLFILAHLSRRLRIELIVFQSSRRPYVRACVRPSVRVFTLSNMNISEPMGWSQPNFIWSIIGFGERLHLVLGQIESELWFPWQQKAPHRVVMEKTVSPLFLACFSSDPFHTCS